MSIKEIADKTAEQFPTEWKQLVELAKENNWKNPATARKHYVTLSVNPTLDYVNEKWVPEVNRFPYFSKAFAADGKKYEIRLYFDIAGQLITAVVHKLGGAPFAKFTVSKYTPESVFKAVITKCKPLLKDMQKKSA